MPHGLSHLMILLRILLYVIRSDSSVILLIVQLTTEIIRLVLLTEDWRIRLSEFLIVLLILGSLNLLLAEGTRESLLVMGPHKTGPTENRRIQSALLGVPTDLKILWMPLIHRQMI